MGPDSLGIPIVLVNTNNDTQAFSFRQSIYGGTIKLLKKVWCYVLRVPLIATYILFHYACALLSFGKRKYIPPIDNPLLLKSATALAKDIREGRIKSKDVVQAYIKRILDVEPYINATVDHCFQEALEEAKDVDNLIESAGLSKEELERDKPFLGVPLSVKILLKVKGLRCTSGSMFLKDDIASEDAPTVKLMKRAGAIVIVTTNIPEFGMNFETNNMVHGRTCNPYDTRRTSGGSSGGESALIAAAGSVIGLANDLGGSIRVPCHFTGLFGHKPSAGIVPNGGNNPEFEEYFGDYLCTGPMCRYAEDLVTSMKVLNTEGRVPLNFGHMVDFKKLKIYYMVQINSLLVSTVDKEIEQRLTDVATYFQSNYGCEVKKIEFDLLHEASECSLYNILSKVNETGDLKIVFTHGRASHVNKLLDLIKYFFGKSEFTKQTLMGLMFLKFMLFYFKDDIPHYQELLEKLRKQFECLIDDNTVFLFPTFPKTAPYHNEMFLLFPSSCYTSIFNILGLPSTQCPIGLNKQGMPYGIQIISKMNNDALTIRCAVELERVFGGWVPPGSK